MKDSLRIAIAEDEDDMREFLEKTLPLFGHQVVVVARTGRELLEQCRVAKPDLIISDIKMPEIDGIEAVSRLFEERVVPVILISAYHDRALIDRAGIDNVFGYLLKPISSAALEPAISVAMHRFQQFDALKKEAGDMRQALEDRKVIERAKGVLMKRAAIDEAEAFRRLQKLAMEWRSKMVDIAKMILTVEEASQPKG